MSRFVTVDGATYFSTADVNLLSADVSHLSQSKDNWTHGGQSAALVWDNSGDSPWGNLTGTTVSAATAHYAAIAGMAITTTPGVHTLMAKINNQAGAARTLYAILFDNVGNQSDTSTTIPAGESVVATELTMSGTSLTQIRFGLNSTDVEIGDVWSISQIMVAKGSVSTFVPSLRIVADDTYVKSPAGLTAAFTEGVSLTVGVAWAGDAVKMELLDGVGGPSVATLDADDVYAAVGYGALSNGATWVDSVTGRTWTVNGTGAVVGYSPGVGTYADVDALGAIRDRLILGGEYSETTAPRGIVGALNAFLGTSAGDVEGALNEKAATTDLGAVAAINSLLGSATAFEVNDGLRQLAESYDPA